MTATVSPNKASVSKSHLMEFDHVSFVYDDTVDGRVVALDDVSFAIDVGGTYAITGPNGSGKSTILRVLNGLSFPGEGAYRFDGSVIDARAMKDQLFAKRFHQRVGYVFQNSDTQLFCPSVTEEIAFGPRQMGLSEEDVEARTKDMMELLGIEHLATRAPYRLSGGEKRKVAIACIISMNPDVLVLDEPMNGLDEDSQDWLLDFLKKMAAAGKTIIVTTHHRDIVGELDAAEIHLDKHHHIAR